MNKQEFTKEQLDAIAIVDNLYSLNKDMEIAWQIFHDKNKDNKINLCKLKRTTTEFRYAIPSMFISFVEAIENGDLIFKEDTK